MKGISSVEQSLNTIGLENNTDKASLDRSRFKSIKNRDGHNYLVKYESFLNHLKNEKLSMLELGAGPLWNCGASARMWESYFKAAEKIEIAEINGAAKKIESSKVSVQIGDLGELEFLQSFLSTEWDFVIDDASHICWHQMLALKTLFPAVKDGGIFIIEDIHTSFGDLRGKYHEKTNAYQGISDGADAATLVSILSLMVAGGCESHPLIDLGIHGSWLQDIAEKVASITFINHAAIIVKKNNENSYLNYS